MKKVQGYYFPDYDQDCNKVILNQTKDIENVLKYVRNFDVCVQAGGNVGVWPDILADYFNWVITFEPDPLNWECLQKNVKKDNIVMHNTCLSDKNEPISVAVPDEEHKYNCGALQVVEGGEMSMFIDQLELEDCDLIYLDIEGYELFALQGAVKTIEKFKPVICIEEKKLPKNYGVQVGEAVEWLTQFGYRVAETVHRDVICVPS